MVVSVSASCSCIQGYVVLYGSMPVVGVVVGGIASVGGVVTVAAVGWC